MAFRAVLFVALACLPVLARGGNATFSPEQAAPYFATGPAAEAAAHLRLEEFTAAAKGFAEYVKRHPKAKDANQARFALAYAELKAGAFNDAAGHFDALVKPYPLLADYHRTWSARAHLQAGRASEALARAKQVPSTSALDGDARFLRAESLRQLARAADAAAEYDGYLTAFPGSWRAAEVRFRLAEMLGQANKPDEAQEQFRRVFIEHPHESWAQKAESHLKSDPARPFDAAQLAQRAAALFENMRNAESESEWNRVLGAPKLTDALACQARYHVAQSVFKQRDRWRSAPLFEAAADVCQKAKDDDLTTKALYQGGRAWGVKGDKDVAATRKAASLFERVWREHPLHTYADDARLRQAETLESLKEKDDTKVMELLSGLPEAFPGGDQRGEALWRLAFRAWRKGDIDAARKWLETELKLLPREDGWWEAGRTLYWLGRAELKKGDSDKGLTYLERAIEEYPLSYYALQAFNRLRELAPDRATALADKLVADPGDKEGWKWKPRPLFAEPGWKRGLELARLGLGPEAKRELALAGIEVPKKRNEKVTDPDREELLWLAAVLYDRAGEYAISHFIPRYLLSEYARTWPVGANKKKWLLSFPRGYAELIEKHTKINGQPAALEFAIVREESAFDPLMESFANAIGLTQLTAAPAARFAQGLPHDRQALRDPAINVTIGARELGWLWNVYGGNPALAIAGYNAGEGAVGKWLRDPERAVLTTDEWIEAIPYDETRGYTKRVLASYFTYVWLANPTGADRIPQLVLPLPQKKTK
jgi:soluble lytic murein transglycosylase